jgi:FkbM family methyltransferase
VNDTHRNWRRPARSIFDVVRPIARRFRHPGFDEIGLIHETLRSYRPGVMVDVGAHHGGSLMPFAGDGWRVYAIEPDPRNRAILCRRVGRKANVLVDDRAISEHDGERVPLFTSPVSTGISALAPFHPTHQATDSVETIRLDTLLAAVDHVTFLKTDTEGWDLPVLRTFPWDRLHPLAVMCEFEDRKTIPLGYDYHDLAGYLSGLGYAVFTSEWYPVVEYGKRHKWRSLRRYPVQLDDVDAWGNLLAISPELADSIALAVTRLKQRPSSPSNSSAALDGIDFKGRG